MDDEKLSDDNGRYAGAVGWQPEDKYKKEREKAGREHERNFSTASLLDARPANEWLEEVVKPPAALLFGDLWREGELAILFAETGAGKSILATQIAESLACGQPIPPFLSRQFAIRNPKVLYLDFELTTAQFNERYSRRSKRGNRLIDHYKFSERLHRSEISWDQGVPEAFDNEANFMAHSIARCIEELDISVLIVDNISWLATANTNAGAALKLMKGLKGIKNSFDVSILVLAHTPKRAIARAVTINDLAGSKMLANFADSIFALGLSAHAPDIRYIKHIKQRNTASPFDASNVLVYRLHKPSNFPRLDFIECTPESNHTTRPYDHPDNDRQTLTAAAKTLAQAGHTQRQIANSLGISLALSLIHI